MQFWKIEAFGNHLGANNNVDVAGMYGIVNAAKLLVGRGVSIETSDAGLWEEFGKFGFKIFSAETFMMNVGIATIRTGGRDRVITSAGVTAHLEAVSVKHER